MSDRLHAQWARWVLATVDDFLAHQPTNAEIVAVEFLPTAFPLPRFVHPERCVYVFGAEDGNVPPELLKAASATVMIPSAFSLNLAACGNVVLYDRLAKA